MEISGTVLRHVSYVSGGGTNTRSRGVVPRVRVRMGTGSGFCDEAHLQYYNDSNKKVLTTKKKSKLLKGFSKLGLAQDPQKLAMFYDLQQNLTSDAGQVLLRELEEARAKEKEMKKKRKQEKKEKKAKLKASKMNCESSSSSSSESSDSDCDPDQVVDMNSLRAGVGVVAPAPVDESPLPKTTIVEDAHRDAMKLCAKNDVSVSSVCSEVKNECAVVTNAPQKRIEVCMGNKCKRSGAAALLQEFEKVVGVEGGAVVGCKCMGKCKTAPNVRVQSSVDHTLAQGLDDSVKIPVNPLCIGVGLEDVDAIVARFLGENDTDLGLASAAT